MAFAALRTGGTFSTRGGGNGVSEASPPPSVFAVAVTAVVLVETVPWAAVVAAADVWAFWPSDGNSVRRTGS